MHLRLDRKIFMPPPDQLPRLAVINEAIAALDRRRAAAILRQDLEAGPASGDVWQDVSKVAARIGEHRLSQEAARRYAAAAPTDMDHVFFYALVLSRSGQLAEALQQLDRLPAAAQAHPAILHFRAMTATQMGNFTEAEQLLEKALAVSPAPVQWLALSVAKKFRPGDPHIAQMEGILPRVGRAPPAVQAQLYYSLGKAYDDVKDTQKAASAYAMGAQLMRNAATRPDARAWDRFASHLIAGYTCDNMAKLTPSGATSDRVIFVTGFPRSGTTLLEQILTSHSQVKDGAELNLVSVALMPTGDSQFDASHTYPGGHARETAVSGNFAFEDAMAYQTRSGEADPWGEIGRDYLHMAEERFGPEGRVVDKTLNLGSFMGLLLHTLPNAKILRLRRNPEDCALSNYRMYSQLGTLPWTNSATDIADFFRTEERLYAHWAEVFPGRIFDVPYEDLVSDPQTWIRRILDHAGLPEEPQVFEPHKSTRAVTTASMAQVRSPISTSRIGAAEAYKDFTEEFRRAYYAK